MILEMIRHHSVADVFFAAKTLRNAKPNMVETMVSTSKRLYSNYPHHSHHGGELSLLGTFKRPLC